MIVNERRWLKAGPVGSVGNSNFIFTPSEGCLPRTLERANKKNDPRRQRDRKAKKIKKKREF